MATVPSQLELSLRIEKEVEIDGVGMGVLSDGTAYLTGRGLARMCGIDNSMIIRINNGWSDASKKPREQKIVEILSQQGLAYVKPFIQIKTANGSVNAYPDSVCMAILEYYAFEAGSNCTQQAQKNFRLLARRSFREFIYTQVGYDPSKLIPETWRQFHDRVSLVYHTVPHGYFSVFKEVADIIVTMIRGGASVGSKFVPDISVGQHWSKHWMENQLDSVYGARIKYEHNYPDYFPQAGSNPQFPFCYPDSALAEFRRWIREKYLVGAFPKYLKDKDRDGALPPSFQELALSAIQTHLLPKK